MQRAKSIARSVKNFIDALFRDRVEAYSAQAAFFIILSFFPCLIILIALIKYTPITAVELYTTVHSMVPAGMDNVVINLIGEAYSQPPYYMSVFALVVAWSAGRGFMALIRGMNTIYKVDGRHGYFVLRMRSILYTIALLLVVIFSLVILVFGNMLHETVTEYFPFMADVTGFLTRLNGLVMMVFLTLFFMVLYCFVPDRKANFFCQAPGGLFSGIGWYIFTIGFSAFVENSPSINNLYGSLTTAMIIMLWLYFCMYILLIGAEINSYYADKFLKFADPLKLIRGAGKEQKGEEEKETVPEPAEEKET